MLQELYRIFQGTDIRILATILTVLTFLLLRWMIFKVINRRIKEMRNRYTWRQTVNLVLIVLSAMLIIRVWFEWFQSVVTLLSVVAAAITVVSKELLLNFFSYGIIAWRSLFTVGDRIEVDGHVGDVTEIGPFYFTLAEIGNWVNADEPTGRLLKMPNSLVLTKPVANYARGKNLIWNELSLRLDPRGDWRKAREIAAEVAASVSHSISGDEFKELRGSVEEIMFLKTEPSVYLRIQENYLVLTIRYLCKFHKRRKTELEIWEALLARLSESDNILFAAPSSGSKASAQREESTS